MKEQALMSAVFDLVEHLTKSELTNIAKTLIYNYFTGSERPTARERAREAVFRYAQCKSLPTLNDVRKKSRERSMLARKGNPDHDKSDQDQNTYAWDRENRKRHQ